MLPAIEPWHWMAAGVALAVLEVVAPTTAFVWLGAAAFVTGLAAWVVPLGLTAQLIIFGVLAVLAIGITIRLRRHRVLMGRKNEVNRGADRFIGQRAMLDGPLANGSGRVRLGDTVWSVTGPDLPDGAAVVVTGMDGSTLVVRAG